MLSFNNSYIQPHGRMSACKDPLTGKGSVLGKVGSTTQKLVYWDGINKRV